MPMMPRCLQSTCFVGSSSIGTGVGTSSSSVGISVGTSSSSVGTSLWLPGECPPKSVLITAPYQPSRVCPSSVAIMGGVLALVPGLAQPLRPAIIHKQILLQLVFL